MSKENTNKCFFCEERHYLATKTGATMELIEGDRLEIETGMIEPIINIEINYCPFCGRELKHTRDKGYIIRYVR